MMASFLILTITKRMEKWRGENGEMQLKETNYNTCNSVKQYKFF